MTVTVEAPPRSRAALLAKTLEEREIEKATLLQQIARYAQEEDQARREALAKAPTKRSDAMGSPVAEARQKREKAETKLAHLEPELMALREALRVAAREEAIETIEQACDRSEAYREAELDAYRKVGELFVACFDAWVEGVVPVLGEAEQFRSEILRGGLLDSVPTELRERWQQVGKPRILPVPVEFARVLERMVDVALDPGGEGYRQVDNRETARSDEARLLPSLVEDRRHANRRVAVHTGDVPTTVSTRTG